MPSAVPSPPGEARRDLDRQVGSWETLMESSRGGVCSTWTTDGPPAPGRCQLGTLEGGGSGEGGWGGRGRAGLGTVWGAVLGARVGGSGSVWALLWLVPCNVWGRRVHLSRRQAAGLTAHMGRCPDRMSLGESERESGCSGRNGPSLGSLPVCGQQPPPALTEGRREGAPGCWAPPPPRAYDPSPNS